MKYIDLIGIINTAVRGQSGSVVQFDSTSDLDRRAVLRWLDLFPDQVPGRTIKPTITASEVTEVAGTLHADLVTRCIEYMDLATVAPEPTNAQSIDKLLIEFAQLNASCGGGQGDHDLAVFLDARGVKAGGNNE